MSASTPVAASDLCNWKVYSSVAIVAIPMGVGVALVAEELVLVVLGDQWIDATGLLRILAYHAIIRALCSPGVNLLIVTEHIKHAAILSISRAVVFVSSVYPAYLLGSLSGVAMAKTSVELAGGILLLFVVARIRSFKMTMFLTRFLRPAVASGIMAIILISLAPWFSNVVSVSSGVVVTLFCKGAVGMVVYGLSLFGLWRVFGKASDLEGEFLRLFVEKWRSPEGSRS